MIHDSKLIFDLGAHHGRDTRRYLAEGFKVIAVEANPDCIPHLSKLPGDLQVVKRALHSKPGEYVKLYTSNSPEGETHSLFPSRVKQCDDVAIEVNSCTLAELLKLYGVPWYMKVDIEGSDVVAIRQLHEWKGAKPPYLSVELDWEHPEEAIEMFSLLGYMGYTSFTLINQWNPAGPTTVMPNTLTYGCTLMEAIGNWAEDGGYKGWWFDLHARHKDAT